MEIFVLLLGIAVLVLIVWKSSKSSHSQHTTLPDQTADPLDFSSLRPPPSSPDRPSLRPLPSGEASPVRRVLKGRAWVVDGDTIDVERVRLRLFGIDAPEMDHPYGKQAKWAMVKLCKGHLITAEIVDEDAHGRTVARCLLPDGRDLSAELVKQGLALDWPKYSGGKYRGLETEGVRKKLWRAAVRQQGRAELWDKYPTAQQRRDNS
ncbi:thermonuclease family protein [Maliponia aquimaris]|uniref:thermonuclease family protein n=1 Tax=Maliponia aquimaris TaxID=1673631 RepID=UPI001FE5ED81|nr:thermonuclease family protein [Maliponia aquimaris]